VIVETFIIALPAFKGKEGGDVGARGGLTIVGLFLTGIWVDIGDRGV